MRPLNPERPAFIDLKTTGSNPLRDRITEIGVLQVEGNRVTPWSTLVNPERPIPEFIQQRTGIRHEMLVDAPTFAEVAQELADRLRGRLFIAYHARFDYAFLKSEYRRLGQNFRADVLCALRLSRKLFPECQGHHLDHLIVRHGLVPGDRRRALADAALIWQFWQALQRERGAHNVAEAVRQQLKRPGLPPHLDAALLDDLPEGPGVYLFHGDNDALLYVGKSVNLRRRVLSHFAADLLDHKEMRLSQEVRRIDWHQTVGELGALLLESRLVKECQPIHNRRLRRSADLCAWQLPQGADGNCLPRLVSGQNADFGRSDELFGLFTSRRQANDTLRKIAAADELCLILLGLEKPARRGRPCFAHQVNRCRGACVGKEAIDVHQRRMMSALLKLKLKAWPYRGPIGIVERDEFRAVEEVHLVDGWRHLGSARSETEIHELLRGRAGLGQFDRDTYRLLSAHLEKGAVQVRLLTDR